MFQDKANSLIKLWQDMTVEEEEASEVAGGGGGPESSEEEPAVNQQEEPEVSGDETKETDDAPETPEEAQVEESKSQPEASSGDEDSSSDDSRAFEEALNSPMPGFSKEGGQVDYSGTFQSLSEGDVVEGTVVHIDREGVLVDVGTKSEGVIRMNELTRDSFQNPEEVVSVGEKISVYVLQTENSDGNLLLSKKRADFEVAWDRVFEAHKEGKTISAMVSDRVKGGLVVDLGIRGFVPASHVGSGKVKNLDKYVGQSLPLKVIEVDRERRKVVLSHRMAVEEERDKKRDETLQNLAEGQERTGVVRRITEYGAFVDLGGIDGLLHISEMSWTRINHPSEVVKVGQKIQVMVLKMNLESGRVSLGMRQILPDPWQNLGDRYKVGDVIKGKISRLVNFGAFVQLEEGIEAIIPNSELTVRRIKKPEQVVSVGDEMEVRIMEVRPDERRMTLSARAVMQEREIEAHTPPPPPQQTSREAPRTTVADLLGDSFAELEREMNKETKAKSRKRKQTRDREQERAEAEAFGDLSDEELLDLAVTNDVEAETTPEGASEPEEVVETVEETPAEEAAAEEEAPVGEETPAEEAVVEEEAPAVEETSAEEAAVDEEAPVVEETPAVEEDEEKS